MRTGIDAMRKGFPGVATAAAAAAAVLIAGTAGFGPRAAGAEDPTPLAIGSAMPDFSLPGVDGRTYGPGDFRDAKALMVVFTCNHCPTAQAYEDRLIKLHEDYKDKGAALVAISPNDPLAVRLDELGYSDLNDSFEEMKIRARDKKFPFPYLYDGETQETSRAFGALATPHVFLFDAERRLRYAGRIDDSEVREPTSEDARAALEAVLAGRAPEPATTRVFGCSTKWSDKRESARESLAKWDMEPVGLEDAGAEALKELAAGDGKRYRLVNVWATWCGPCVAELPELTTIHRMYRNRPFELATISVDQPGDRDKALEILKRNRLSARNLFWSGDSNLDALAEALDAEWPGPVPYTILIDPSGKVLYRKVGEFDPLELKRTIVDHLGRTYASRGN